MAKVRRTPISDKTEEDTLHRMGMTINSHHAANTEFIILTKKQACICAIEAYCQ